MEVVRNAISIAPWFGVMTTDPLWPPITNLASPALNG